MGKTVLFIPKPDSGRGDPKRPMTKQEKADVAKAMDAAAKRARGEPEPSSRGKPKLTATLSGPGLDGEVDITAALERAGAFKGRSDTRQAEAFDRSQTGEAFSGDQLKSVVQRIERLEEEKKTIADDIRSVFGEAKGNGFDVKILRKVIALRKRDLNERRVEESLIDLYLQAVGDER